MRLELLGTALGVLVVAAVAVNFLNDAGFQDAPVLVIAAGILASGAVTLLR
jgi:hypothetical protein